MNKIAKTEQELDENSNFYNTFKESDAYGLIQRSSQEFLMPFENLW